jgi:3-dehydrosphinganine reductase
VTGTASGAPVAVISGGSSGIGLAIAHLLGAKGYRLCLLARDPSKLERARSDLAGSAPAGVEIFPLDVADEAACFRTMAAIAERLGPISWLVTSAGIAEPGLFIKMPSEQHRRQMEVNYFGTLNLVRPAVEAMRLAGKGRITLISSAAAFVGIAGYSAYAPGKSALKALAETLYVELASHGIEVSAAFPPDTDTPQLAAEQAMKPEITKRISAGGGVMSAEAVARSIVAGALAGRFMLTPGPLITAFGLFHSLYAPFFRRKQRRILRELGSGG